MGANYSSESSSEEETSHKQQPLSTYSPVNKRRISGSSLSANSTNPNDYASASDNSFEIQANSPLRLYESDLRKLLEILVRHAGKWKQIGTALDFNPSTLDLVESMPRLLSMAPTSYLEEMLKKWLQWTPATNGTYATLESLEEALRSPLVELSALAEGLRAIFTGASCRDADSSNRTLPAHVLRYSKYLKGEYQEILSEIPKPNWPPSVKIPVRLTIIDKRHKKQSTDTNEANSSEGVGLDGFHHEESIQYDCLYGNVDNIVSRKKQIEVTEIFQPIHKHNSNVPLRILMDGAPGVGKTTQTLQICKDWALGKILQEFCLVVLAPLRELYIKTAGKVEELFPGHHDCCDLVNKVVHFIKNTPEFGKYVLLIFDGFDELSEEERTKESLFLNVIKRRYLSKCCVLVTSRPYASYCLYDFVDCHVEILGLTETQIQHCIMQNMPNEEKAKELMVELQQRLDVASLCYVPLNCAIIMHVYQKKWVLPSTLTEIYTTFILCCLKRHAKIVLNDSWIDSQLDSLRNLPEPVGKQLDTLCKMAYEGFCKNKFIFNCADLLESCSDDDNEIPRRSNIECYCLSLMTSMVNFSSTLDQMQYQFLHLSIQEFLAARYIANKCSQGAEKLLSFFLKTFNDYRFSLILQFLAGLTKLNVHSPEILFNQLFPVYPFEHYVQVDLLDCTNFLRVCSLIFESQFSCLEEEVNIDRCSELFSCLLKCLSEKCQNFLSLRNDRLSLFDCMVIAHFLCSTNNSWKELNLIDCSLNFQSIDAFNKVFSFYKRRNKSNMSSFETINLCSNCTSLGNVVFRLPWLSNTKHLICINLYKEVYNVDKQFVTNVVVDSHSKENSIFANQHESSMPQELETLEVEHCSYLVESIRKGLIQTNTLKRLHLWQIDTDGIIGICLAIGKNFTLEDLGISWNKQDENDKEVGHAIATMLEVNQSLKVLRLRGGYNIATLISNDEDYYFTPNNIENILNDNELSVILSSCLKAYKLDTIQLCDLKLKLHTVQDETYDLHDSDWKLDTDWKQSDKYTLPFLFCALSQSDMGYSVIPALKVLDLNSASICSSRAIAIFQVLQDNTHLKELDLSCNSQLTVDSSDAVGDAIKKMLEKNKVLEKLDLHGETINDNIVECIVDALAKNSTLKELNIDENSLSERVVTKLLSLIASNSSSKIKSLHLCGVSLLNNSRIIWNVSKSSTSLYFSDPFTATKSVCQFFGALRSTSMIVELNSGHLDMSEVDITSDTATSVLQSVNDNTVKLTKLDLPMNKVGNTQQFRGTLKNFLKANKSLRIVTVQSNIINDILADAIADGLANNITLQNDIYISVSLNLNINDIPQIAIVKLLHFYDISKFSKVRKVNFDLKCHRNHWKSVCLNTSFDLKNSSSIVNSICSIGYILRNIVQSVESMPIECLYFPVTNFKMQFLVSIFRQILRHFYQSTELNAESSLEVTIFCRPSDRRIRITYSSFEWGACIIQLSPSFNNTLEFDLRLSTKLSHGNVIFRELFGAMEQSTVKSLNNYPSSRCENKYVLSNEWQATCQTIVKCLLEENIPCSAKNVRFFNQDFNIDCAALQPFLIKLARNETMIDAFFLNQEAVTTDFTRSILHSLEQNTSLKELDIQVSNDECTREDSELIATVIEKMLTVNSSLSTLMIHADNVIASGIVNGLRNNETLISLQLCANKIMLNDDILVSIISSADSSKLQYLHIKSSNACLDLGRKESQKVWKIHSICGHKYFRQKMCLQCQKLVSYICQSSISINVKIIDINIGELSTSRMLELLNLCSDISELHLTVRKSCAEMISPSICYVMEEILSKSKETLEVLCVDCSYFSSSLSMHIMKGLSRCDSVKELYLSSVNNTLGIISLLQHNPCVGHVIQIQAALPDWKGPNDEETNNDYLLGHAIATLLSNSKVKTFQFNCDSNWCGIASQHRSPVLFNRMLPMICIPRDGMQLIFKALQQNTHLLKLGLSCNVQSKYSEAVGHALGEMLKMNKTLKSLDLHNCIVDEFIIKGITNGLINNTSLNALFLNEYLLEKSVQCSTIENGLITLHSAINSSNVSSLNYSSSVELARARAIDASTWICNQKSTIPPNLIHIINASTMSFSLRKYKLYVESLDCQSESASKAEKLFEYIGNIEELLISSKNPWCQSWSDDNRLVVIEAIAKGVERLLVANKSLKLLDFSGSCLSTHSSILKHLARGLKCNSCSLKRLILRAYFDSSNTCNEFHDQLIIIFESLKHNTGLEVLSIDLLTKNTLCSKFWQPETENFDTNRSLSASSACEGLLTTNITLKSLYIKNLHCGEFNVAAQIFKGLCNNGSIVELDITSQNISFRCNLHNSQQYIVALVDMLSRNTALENLSVTLTKKCFNKFGHIPFVCALLHNTALKTLKIDAESELIWFIKEEMEGLRRLEEIDFEASKVEITEYNGNM